MDSLTMALKWTQKYMISRITFHIMVFNFDIEMEKPSLE